MDGKLALTVTDMRLAQVDGMIRQLMREHPDDYQEPLSEAVDRVHEAHRIVKTLNGSPPPEVDGVAEGGAAEA